MTGIDGEIVPDDIIPESCDFDAVMGSLDQLLEGARDSMQV